MKPYMWSCMCHAFGEYDTLEEGRAGYRSHAATCPETQAIVATHLTTLRGLLVGWRSWLPGSQARALDLVAAIEHYLGLVEARPA